MIKRDFGKGTVFMKKAKREKNVRLVVAILVAVSGVAAIPGIVLFALNSMWLLMAVCCALTVHTFYGVTFYFIAFASAQRRYRVVCAVLLHGLRSVSSIAEFCMRPYNTVERDTMRCIERGFFPGLVLRGDTLVPVVSEIPKEWEPINCEYCGLPLKEGERVCPNCAAPVEAIENN